MADLDKSKIQAVAQYIDEVSKQFSTGKATEHSYRPALAKLLGDLLPKFTITNEPSRIQCGAPDYIIAKGKGATSIPVAFVEAKDIGDSDLDGNRQHKEQFNRYKNSYFSRTILISIFMKMANLSIASASQKLEEIKLQY